MPCLRVPALAASLATLLLPTLLRAADWQRIGPDGAGLCAVVAAPGNAARVYAGASNGGGGVYRSDDGGRSWRLAAAGLPYRNPICELAVDPADPDWLFTLTYPTAAGSWPGTAWVSSDGGASWAARGGLPNGLFSHDVLVLREAGAAGGRTLLATADDAVWWSRDDGETWCRSTGFPGGFRTVASLTADPFAPRTVYAAVEQGGVSVSRDGGRTWSGLNRGFRRPLLSFLEVTVDPRHPRRLWATVDEGGRWEIYRTSDGGQHWLPSRTGSRPTGSRPTGSRPTGFAFGRVLGSLLPIAGDRLLLAIGGDTLQLLRSADAGLTWRPTGYPAPPSLAMWRFGADLVASGRLGLARSSDLGAHWTDSVAGLRGGTALGLAVDDTGGVAMTTDLHGFLRRASTSAPWVAAGAADLAGAFLGAPLASVPGRPRRLALGVARYGNDAAGFLASTELASSTDRGNHWQTTPVAWCALPGGVAISPRDPRHLFIDVYRAHPHFCPAVCGTFRSTDGGASVECLEPRLPDGRGAHGLAFDPNDGALYGRSDAGAFVRSRDDGDSWEIVHPTIGPGELAFDAHTPGTIYGLYGYDPARILKSVDGGFTWAILDSLPAPGSPVRLAHDPGRAGHLFVATSERVFETVDGGASWFDLSDGLTAVAAGYAMSFGVGPAAEPTGSGLTLYLGTIGSGLLARTVEAPVACGTVAGLGCSARGFCDLPAGQCSTSDLAGAWSLGVPSATIRGDMEATPELKEQIKRLIVERLKLEIDPATIGDSQPLFGEGLGLDSIDALELVLGIEQTFGVKVEDEEVGAKALSSVDTLAGFVAAKRSA